MISSLGLVGNIKPLLQTQNGAPLGATEVGSGQAPFRLPADALTTEFDSVAATMSNLLERGDSARLREVAEARSILLGVLRLSLNTHATLRYIVAQVPENPARKLEFAISAPLLTRSTLDALFTVVFLFGDLERRLQWYVQAGWREVREHHDRLVAAFTDDPTWSEYISKHAAYLAEIESRARIPASAVSNPNTIPYWPIPSQILKSKDLNSDRRPYLEYLYNWHYKVLSQDAHLSLPGLVRRATFLMPPFVRAPDRDERLVRLRSDAFAASSTLVLALISELELELRFNIASRLQYLWTLLASASPDAKDLYELFYATYFRSSVNSREDP